MKILTKENASELLGGGQSPDTFVSQLSSRLRLVGDTYSIPRDAGRKTALSRVFAYLLLRKSSVCVYVTGWGVWGSSENLDLFYGYRRSFGDCDCYSFASSVRSRLSFGSKSAGARAFTQSQGARPMRARITATLALSARPHILCALAQPASPQKPLASALVVISRATARCGEAGFERLCLLSRQWSSPSMV